MTRSEKTGSRPWRIRRPDSKLPSHLVVRQRSRPLSVRCLRSTMSKRNTVDLSTAVLTVLCIARLSSQKLLCTTYEQWKCRQKLFWKKPTTKVLTLKLTELLSFKVFGKFFNSKLAICIILCYISLKIITQAVSLEMSKILETINKPSQTAHMLCLQLTWGKASVRN